MEFNYDKAEDLLSEAARLMQNSIWRHANTSTVLTTADGRKQYDLLGSLMAAGSPYMSIRESVVNPKGGRTYGRTDRTNIEKWQKLLSRRGRQTYVQCLQLLMESTGHDDLERWNDEVAQEKWEVVEALRLAAQLARERA